MVRVAPYTVKVFDFKFDYVGSVDFLKVFSQYLLTTQFTVTTVKQ